MEHTIHQLMKNYDNGLLSRRQVVNRLAALFALVGTASARAAESGPSNQQESTFEATELNHVALRVTDVKRSRDFYMKHLGLQLSRDSDSSAFLTFGNNFLALFRGDTPGLDHYCYSIRNYDVGAAEKKLQDLGMPNIRRTSGRIYFDDPDGITVQLAGERHAP